MIKFSALVDELRRLGEEYPDRQSKAMYFEGGKPSCIVGHAFVNLDTDIQERRYSDEEGAGILTRHGATIAYSTDTISTKGFDWETAGFRAPTAKQLQWASAVQAGQDSGWSWGYAVERADKDKAVV